MVFRVEVGGGSLYAYFENFSKLVILGGFKVMCCLIGCLVYRVPTGRLCMVLLTLWGGQE